MQNIISEINRWPIGCAVETVTDTRAIGSVQSAHVNYATVLRYTKTQIIVKNEHGNLQRHYLKNGFAVGTDRLTPNRLVRC